jgi:hypothetical protein
MAGLGRRKCKGVKGDNNWQGALTGIVRVLGIFRAGSAGEVILKSMYRHHLNRF